MGQSGAFPVRAYYQGASGGLRGCLRGGGGPGSGVLIDYLCYFCYSVKASRSGGMADAYDSKSYGKPCGFKSHLRHHIFKKPTTVGFFDAQFRSGHSLGTVLNFCDHFMLLIRIQMTIGAEDLFSGRMA